MQGNRGNCAGSGGEGCRGIEETALVRVEQDAGG